MAAGRGEDGSGRVEMRAEVGARRDARTLAEDLGGEIAEIENRGDAGVEEGGEVLGDVGKHHPPRRVCRGARVRVDVDEPGQERCAATVDLRDAIRGEAGRSDGVDAAVAHAHVAQAVGERRPRRIEDADVAQDQRPGRAGRARHERRRMRAGRRGDEQRHGEHPAGAFPPAHKLPLSPASRRHKAGAASKIAQHPHWGFPLRPSGLPPAGDRRTLRLPA